MTFVVVMKNKAVENIDSRFLNLLKIRPQYIVCAYAYAYAYASISGWISFFSKNTVGIELLWMDVHWIRFSHFRALLLRYEDAVHILAQQLAGGFKTNFHYQRCILISDLSYLLRICYINLLYLSIRVKLFHQNLNLFKVV